MPDPDPEPVVPGNYTVSAIAGAGGSIDPTSRAVSHGDKASFTVIPGTGYSIDQVVGCDGVLDGNTYTTGEITAACMVSATFALVQYTLTYAAGPNGTLDGETVQTVSHGASGTAVTAVPDTGYSFVEWSDASTANPRTDSNVTGDLSLTASFALKSYSLNATATPGGDISPDSQVVDHGATAAFTVTPETGYGIDSVSGCGGSLEGNTYTTGMITEACTVEATFLLNSYTVSTTSGPGGNISPDSQVVDHGATAAFTVTPETGYGIDSVSGCGGSLEGSLYTTSVITEACEIQVLFRALDLSWSLEGGELVPATAGEPTLYDLHERLLLGADVNPSDISWSGGDPSIPEWLNLSFSSGLLSGTPSESDVGSNAFQVVAARIDGESRSAVYTIKVGKIYLDVVQLSAGGNHTCAVTTDGGAKCWGFGWNGQLGNGEPSQHATPVNVTGLTSGVVSISAGSSHTCAVTTDGAAWCWGWNYWGELGDGTFESRPTPILATGLPLGVVSISAGDKHTCAVDTDGAAWCWGYGLDGRLGDGSTEIRHAPVLVTGLVSGVASISAGGDHTCVVHIGGAKCWGSGGSGQLGDGSGWNSNIPVSVSDLTSGVVSISAGGQHTCAVTTDGGAKCWGYGGYGQLGDGTIGDTATPVNVTGLTSGVASISTGWNHTCAVHEGAAKCWGYGGYGQLGDGNITTRRTTPVDVTGLTSGVVSISAHQDHTCAVDTDGGAKCWGYGGAGQLGDDESNNQVTPVGVLWGEH